MHISHSEAFVAQFHSVLSINRFEQFGLCVAYAKVWNEEAETEGEWSEDIAEPDRNSAWPVGVDGVVQDADDVGILAFVDVVLKASLIVSAII